MLQRQAAAPEGLESALRLAYPEMTRGAVLAFSIDEEGRILRIAAREGSLGSAVPADAARLAALQFTPARRKEAAVASVVVLTFE